MAEAKMKNEENNNDETMNFETDVSRLLDIVTNALYSNRDVFLRELISNSADACDRLRYQALQDDKLTKGSAPFHIRLLTTIKNPNLTIVDNGIGMNREELISNLGTIARSGTAAILENLKNQGQEKDMNLIGQFGVGFYASFMIAHKVEVVSQKAGEPETWYWESDGKTGFTIREANDDEKAWLTDAHGTAIRLHVNSDSTDYLLEDEIKRIVLEYSDHVEVPIYFNKPEEGKEDEQAPINAASALWTRPKSEITQEQYNEFYHHTGQLFDDPIMTTHWTAEGVIEYTALLFIPTMRPWDLYDPDRKTALRLYVKRVFITDKLDTLLHPWLRFVKGIVDSQDLPLNISREMLQSNPVVHKIRNGVTKKILSEIQKLSEKDEEAFDTLWGQFGAVLKEGLYDAIEHRPDLFKICRFNSTNKDAPMTSLDEYIERMKDGQDTIYYITGENAESLSRSPQIEGLISRGIEVLLMTDTVDEFWLQQVKDYKEKKFKSVTQGNINLDEFSDDKDSDAKNDNEETASDDDKEMDALTLMLQTQLAEQVNRVRVSKRLTESPVCLVADDGGVDMHMEKVLKLQQKYEPSNKPVLEINPTHPLIKKMANMVSKDAEQETLKDTALLLMDQALIIQGDSVTDPAAFAKRMASFIEKGLGS